jgi:7,8-dihydropterin-6-yl-methyl-4-(beta-D-ribofuranosyl)aminobenzene 5'-phosphate synthase
MKVCVIVENSVRKPNGFNVKSEHGLCLHIECGGEKILFDTGQSDLFIKNAEKMGLDLSEVDYLFLSHGHIDHGGGLHHFFNVNSKAKVIMHRAATCKYFAKILGVIPYYVGLDQKLLKERNGRIIFLDRNTSFSNYIQVITSFPKPLPLPKANSSLYVNHNGMLVRDSFNHEIILILTEDKKNFVFTACSHSGIINIMEGVKRVVGELSISAVFGGFHTYNPITRISESKEYLENLVSYIELHCTNSTFFTGHCTGRKSFVFLKNKLGSSLQPMNCGDILFV